MIILIFTILISSTILADHMILNIYFYGILNIYPILDICRYMGGAFIAYKIIYNILYLL